MRRRRLWLGGLRNLPLWLGGALVTLLAAWAFVGPLVAPHDPLARTRIVQDAAGAWHTSPLDPMEIDAHVLGTDHDGRDILSRLLWAMRPTLYLAIGAAAAWLVLGTGIGFVAGWLDGRGRWTATSLIDAAAATPLLILAIIVLYFLGEERSIRQFVLALSVTGWASTAQLVAVQVRSLRREGYVEAARSLGAGDGHIARRHVLPHLLPLAPVVLAFQVGTVLLILGELGFLGFYVGGGEARSLPDPNSTAFFTKVIPGQPELAQMLGVGWDNFFQQPWLSVWAGAAFFLAVFAFMLFGEGIKRAVEV